MNLGLMQPYFVPYLGYFDLIRQTDRWIIFDSAQYIRRGWVNRNRVHKQSGGWAYVTVPVKYAPLETPIRQIAPDNSQEWVDRILAQFDALQPAPFHAAVRELLAPALRRNHASLAELNAELIAGVCAYLEIPFRARRLSELQLDLGPIHEPGDWALQLCRTLGADGYLNPAGGRDLYSNERFRAAGVKLAIQEFTPFVYPVAAGFTFEPNLSILDVLAWNSPAAVRHHLDAQPRYFPGGP